jgi:phytoene dehydrogenase-like protein
MGDVEMGTHVDRVLHAGGGGVADGAVEQVVAQRRVACRLIRRVVHGARGRRLRLDAVKRSEEIAREFRRHQS